ncbi:Nif3-like dinuclear metal center hexameric protein [Shewanella maritima]|uniref:GTP cyclohydrolase 1 type 2 homolog n=1 Tax=Shewanella maritima TaxID=2520507 RepID=A0A411PN78_9GAMM|nr:Nif3-like dinuclear metal center hexameric protein [Shewanella maritima]QBF84984.1 Nif3-like dinuclear metal center hexameric protein [Shewanella maritima]
MSTTELTQYLADYLQVDQYKDYAPNGLQVQGSEQITRIVTGVTACQALIDKAVEVNADAILVHHGFFWKSEPEVLTGMKYQRISALIKNDINLFGYHLPIDGHPQIGNNAQLASKIGVALPKIAESVKQNLLWHGELEQALAPQQLAKRLNETLAHKPLHIGEAPELIKTVAWCTGGAQDYIDAAVELGVDAFISGEVSERTFHAAMEQNIHYFAAGHHATERYGIQALGEHLADKFGLEHQFIDIYNPV